jgi:hypothetical protein
MLAKLRLKDVGFGLALLVLGGVAGFWLASGSTLAAEDEKVTIDGLLQEKLTTLREIAAHAEGLFKSAKIDYRAVLDAKKPLYAFELELCKTPAERIAKLEETLAFAKQLEEFNIAQVQAARATRATVLEAKLFRLDVEIALLRAKDESE